MTVSSADPELLRSQRVMAISGDNHHPSSLPAGSAWNAAEGRTSVSRLGGGESRRLLRRNALGPTRHAMRFRHLLELWCLIDRKTGRTGRAAAWGRDLNLSRGRAGGNGG